MADLALVLPDSMRHIGLGTLAAAALAEEDAWRWCVAIARQESAGIS